MPTANFNLPLIDPAAPISIVNDMNALATAADSAMGTLATSGDIAGVRQVATNANATAQEANTTAREAKASADTANAAAVTAQSAADQANTTAGQAKNVADSASANVQVIMANQITTISLGSVAPSSSLSTTGVVTGRVSKSAASNIALITIDGTSFSFVGGWNEKVTLPVKLPSALRPATEQHYILMSGWFGSAKPLQMEVTVKPTGDVVVLIHPHGVSDSYTTDSYNITYMVGA